MAAPEYCVSPDWVTDPDALTTIIALGLQVGDEVLLDPLSSYDIPQQHYHAVIDKVPGDQPTAYWGRLPGVKPGARYADQHEPHPAVAEAVLRKKPDRGWSDRWILCDKNIVGWRRPS